MNIAGECYAIQNLTKTDRLALLISGRANVLNQKAFLHDVKPGEFLDSPEFESSGLNVPNTSLGNPGAGAATSPDESTFKVTVCAAVPSRAVVWQRQALEYILVKAGLFFSTCVRRPSYICLIEGTYF